MDRKNVILNDIWAKQLVRYGYVQRMDKERLLQSILNWIPTGRRKRGRLKTRWKEGVLREMEKCGLRNGDWEDRLRWILVSKDVAIRQNDYIHAYTYTHTHTHTNSM
jgi:hypothetical protein